MNWISSKVMFIIIGDSIASLLTISSTFNSLFKVLCIFPSRYLCAIGLSPVFSFRWNLPPNLGLHSQTTRLEESFNANTVFGCHDVSLVLSLPGHARDCHPPWSLFPKELSPVFLWQSRACLVMALPKTTIRGSHSFNWKKVPAPFSGAENPWF